MPLPPEAPRGNNTAVREFDWGRISTRLRSTDRLSSPSSLRRPPIGTEDLERDRSRPTTHNPSPSQERVMDFTDRHAQLSRRYSSIHRRPMAFPLEPIPRSDHGVRTSKTGRGSADAITTRVSSCETQWRFPDKIYKGSGVVGQNADPKGDGMGDDDRAAMGDRRTETDERGGVSTPSRSFDGVGVQ